MIRKQNYPLIKTMLIQVCVVGLVACGGGGSGAGGSGEKPTSNANLFMAEMTNKVGLRTFNSGNTGVHGPESWTDTATVNPNGSYTFSAVTKSLISGSWVEQPPASSLNDYYLTSSGSWDLINSIIQVVMITNVDGSISWDDPYYGSTTVTASAVNLSGANINTGTDYSLVLPSGTTTVKVGKTSPMDVNGNYTAASGVIATNATYPVGATEWIFNGTKTKRDVYQVFGTTNSVTTPSGTLTALTTPSQFTSFTAGNPLCTPGFRLTYQSNINVNTSRFSIYAASGPTCTPVVSGTVLATLDLTYTTVIGKPIMQISNCTLPQPNPFFEVYPSGNMTAFFATINGATFMGNKLPVNFILDDYSVRGLAMYGMKNKIAMDAVMNAAGLPTF